MRAKHWKLRRSTEWHADRGIRIGRKVAWRVLGFVSPRAYRLWRNERIRHEVAAGRRTGAFSESPTSETWLAAQPRAFRVDVARSRVTVTSGSGGIRLDSSSGAGVVNTTAGVGAHEGSSVRPVVSLGFDRALNSPGNQSARQP